MENEKDKIQPKKDQKYGHFCMWLYRKRQRIFLSSPKINLKQTNNLIMVKNAEKFNNYLYKIINKGFYWLLKLANL